MHCGQTICIPVIGVKLYISPDPEKGPVILLSSEWCCLHLAGHRLTCKKNGAASATGSYENLRYYSKSPLLFNHSKIKIKHFLRQ